MQENSKGPFRPGRQQADSNEPYSHLQQHQLQEAALQADGGEIEETKTDSSEQEETEEEDQTGEDLGVRFDPTSECFVVQEFVRIIVMICKL
jgi:hypothetical protein